MPGDAPTRRFATITDVAREAGVAVGTASKALNNNGRMSVETRTRIRDIAERLGFRPNNLARSLHTRRTCTVGLLSNDPYGRFSIPILQGLETALGEHDVSVLVCNAGDDRESERRHLDTLLSKRVDGIILTARRIDHRFSIEAGRLPVPAVHVFCASTDPDAVCLVPDERQGGMLATEHLVGLGRRRIVHVTGPQGFGAVQQRARGYRDAMEAAGLGAGCAVLDGAWSEAWGHAALTRLRAAAPLPDAIFCGSDQIARGVLDAAREMGVTVPGDLAVVGFDNWLVMAGAARPPLTTVDPDLQGLGAEAGRTLMGLIAGEGRTAPIQRRPCTLVIRQSCGMRAAAGQAPEEASGPAG